MHEVEDCRKKKKVISLSGWFNDTLGKFRGSSFSLQ